MKKNPPLMAWLFCLGLALFISTKSIAQDCDPINAQQLRAMLVQLGYEVKDLETAVGKEKYSIMTKSHSLDIPIALELSASKRYIWLTVNLGSAPADTSSKHAALLKENSKVQPCLFYITATSKLLMMGLPLDNRGVTNVFLRERLETVSKNVGSTEYIWR